MAASTYERLHELHGLQHFHQFGALFLHDSSGCGVFSVGGLERGSGLVLIHLTTAVLRLTFPQIR